MITTETKARIFAQYIGESCIEHDTKLKFIIFGLHDEHILNINGETTFKLKKLSLFLKSLSDITDEDANEVSAIAGMKKCMNSYQFCISRNVNYTKHILWEYFEGYSPVEDKISGNTYLKIYQYLQSKGYALPYMQYSVEDLLKAGIYKLEE